MQVLEDVRDECGRHGAVVAVKVPRPPQPELSAQMFNTGNYGKVRVQGRACLFGRDSAGRHGRQLSVAECSTQGRHIACLPCMPWPAAYPPPWSRMRFADPTAACPPLTQAFVQFADTAAAEAAKAAINGRMFAGCIVQVTPIAPEAFALL